MARNFYDIIQTAIPYIGDLRAVDTNIGNQKSLIAEIDWLEYGASTANSAVGVSVNVSSGQNVKPELDAIRSVYIDNTFSDIPVYVYFPITGATFICRENATLLTPVIAANLKCIIYAEGFISGRIPQTTVHFMSAIYPPQLSETNFIAPLTAEQLGTGEGFSSSPVSAWTFNNIPLGEPSADRLIIVSFCGQSVADNPLYIESITINSIVCGVAVSRTDRTSSLIYTNLGIYQANVPTGTFGDIVVTGVSNMAGGVISVASIKGYQNEAPLGQGGTVAAGLETLPLNLDINAPGQGVSFWCGMNVAGSSYITSSWGIVNEVYTAQNPNNAPFVLNTFASDIDKLNNSDFAFASRLNSMIGAKWR